MSLLEYNIMKARHGRYADTAENRRLHRVGQEYGHAAQEEQGGSQKPNQKGEEAKEKRTYDTARKELSAVLSHKDEFISKYGEDEYNKRVGALVAEAKTLRDTEHTAEADKDFDKLKQPEKPKDTRSKKEIRTERLEKYKEQLKKVQDKMNEEGASEESRKMGEALEAKWKAKIEKLEAKVNRGSKKAEPSKPEEPEKTPTEKTEGKSLGEKDPLSFSKEERGDVMSYTDLLGFYPTLAYVNQGKGVIANATNSFKFDKTFGEGLPYSDEINEFFKQEFNGPRDFLTKADQFANEAFPVGSRELTPEMIEAEYRSEKALGGGATREKAEKNLQTMRPNSFFLFLRKEAQKVETAGKKKGLEDHVEPAAEPAKTKPEEKEEDKEKGDSPVSWDKQDAFFKKGTDEYKLLDNWAHYHRRKDPFYQREMQKIFEKKFPKIDEWKLTSPNTGRAEIRAIADGKEVASINLNDTEHSTIPMLQTFMDKCQKAGIENRG